MKEHTFEISVHTSRPGPPHFDDEVTVLTARPVVPLEQIDSKLRRRRRWFLGGAFALAMMLGAASALIASYIKLRSQPGTPSQITEVEVEPEPVAVAEPVAIDSSEDLQEVTVPIAPKPQSTVKRSATVTRRDSDASHSRGERELSEEEELRRIRQAILVDEWQERRQRRAERERRNRSEGGGRDLSNLDEIFEGPKRP